MTNVDEKYNEILRYILENGVKKDTRSGPVLSVFGMMARFDLKNGLPVLTTRKVFLRGVIEELVWFLSGNTNIKPLVEKGVNIWNADAERYFNELIDKNNAIRKEFNSKHPEVNDNEYIYEHPTHEEFMQGVLDGNSLLIFNDKWLQGKSIFHRGYDNVRFGDLGPVYGKNWRKFGINGVDQVENLINKLRTNPDDRRLLITGYNPDDVNTAALPPCHLLYQFYTTPMDNGRRKLSCALYCRSQDFLLGTVFNWASASILTYMIAQVVDMEVGELVWIGGDVHVYENQLPMAEELLKREGYDTLPSLELDTDIKNINDFKYEHFRIGDYVSDPPIKIPLSVG